MEIIEVQDKLELRALVKILRGDFKADRTGWEVLKEAELMLFRGVRIFVGLHGSVPVTLNATHFGKRKKNAWEPYANWYIAFTTAEYRRNGYAKELAMNVQKQAAEAGCVRLKALAGTLPGLYLHASLGDQLWAVTDKLEVQVDTPLSEAGSVLGTPPNARKWTDRTSPLSLEQVMQELNGRPLRYCREV